MLLMPVVVPEPAMYRPVTLPPVEASSSIRVPVPVLLKTIPPVRLIPMMFPSPAMLVIWVLAHWFWVWAGDPKLITVTAPLPQVQLENALAITCLRTLALVLTYPITVVAPVTVMPLKLLEL